ncbi:glycosyltransferase [Vibrio parahaemolyticus]|uniref:glycosyltransferase n=1 Tax=Vibrio parahaemolyticus TaxID=670 RepID=UPI001D16C2D3|nr:glycosyltransferase [Vibrio parahaemolyticus]ELB2036799.1 glycosyltransferase [Vibrio parahaemolyticus]MCC3813488.1 glycosyltransferase [Vibrio parahaemolyticus]
MKYMVGVAISVYKSDCLQFFSESITSVLDQECIKPLLFIQVDGVVSDDILEYLKHVSQDRDNVIVEYHDSNKGLAFRLNRCIDLAIEHKVKYLARMDADDISLPNRFITQVDFLDKNLDVDVVGTDVIEISEQGVDVFYKKMEPNHDVIFKNIIRKCPFNHPSVMFRMSVFDNGARYKDYLTNTQDYYLWVDLLSCGYKFSNINEPLLRFRVDSNFHSRRGFKKALNEFKSRLYAFNTLKVYSIKNVIYTMALFFLRLSPSFVKKAAYRLLR